MQSPQSESTPRRLTLCIMHLSGLMRYYLLMTDSFVKWKSLQNCRLFKDSITSLTVITNPSDCRNVKSFLRKVQNRNNRKPGKKTVILYGMVFLPSSEF